MGLLESRHFDNFVHKKHLQQCLKENTEQIGEFNRNHQRQKKTFVEKGYFWKSERVTSKACQKLLEKVKSVAFKGCQKLREKVKSVAFKSVASRACQELLGKVHSITSRACWNASERTLLVHPTPPHPTCAKPNIISMCTKTLQDSTKQHRSFKKPHVEIVLQKSANTKMRTPTCGFPPDGINVIELYADVLFTLSWLMKIEVVTTISQNQ